MKLRIQEFRLAGALVVLAGFPGEAVRVDGASPPTGPANANGELGIRCSAVEPARIGVGEGDGPTYTGPANRRILKHATARDESGRRASRDLNGAF